MWVLEGDSSGTPKIIIQRDATFLVRRLPVCEVQAGASNTYMDVFDDAWPIPDTDHVGCMNMELLETIYGRGAHKCVVLCAAQLLELHYVVN